jgi:uncharacterized protein YdeI (YjbR/CyaY-like superfamily)
MPGRKRDLPIHAFASLEDWERWLAAEHASSNGIWLKLAKKGGGVARLSKAEAVEAALCYGWIDGQIDAFDDRHWLTRFTPRRAESRWSLVNRGRAIELIAAGRMRPAGLAEVERAKADGRWEAAYSPQGSAPIPVDLAEALGLAPEAGRLFESLDSANRYAILYRVENARSASARGVQIAKLVAMLARGETIHPRKKKK